MPLNREEKKRIPASHQVRPYLIVKKIKNTVLAIPTTSNPNQKGRIHFLSHYKYKLPKNKDSFLQCTRIDILKYKHTLQFITKVDMHDMKQTFKEIHILNNHHIYPLPFKVERKYLEYDVGDLLLSGGCYFVYSQYKEDLYAYPAHKKGEGVKCTIGRHSYKIDYQDPRHLSKKNHYEIIEKATEEQLKAILSHKKKR